jgi:hypothetical protein
MASHPRTTYLAGVESVDGAGVVDLAVCFLLCFFTLVAVVSVDVEAAGVCAITVPIMREKPTNAVAKIFI